MGVLLPGGWRAGALALCVLAWGCASGDVSPRRSIEQAAPLRAQEPQAVRPVEERPKEGWTQRVVTEDEISEAIARDPSLSVEACREILARLNTKAPYRIAEDIRKGRPMRAPNDFRAYREWTPIPGELSNLRHIPKLIVVVKEFPFLGWYEQGRLAGDCYACIGVDGQPTEPGLYRVEEKDADHFSRSYSNDFGKPAWMPWALRIYEAVWIHAGDVTGAQCSHGCVTLPMKPAEALFSWAEPGTPVLVVESLTELSRKTAGLLSERSGRK